MCLSPTALRFTLGTQRPQFTLLSSSSLDLLPSKHSQKRQMCMCAEVSRVCTPHYILINQCAASHNYLRTRMLQAGHPDSSSLSSGRTPGGPTGHTKVAEIQWDLGQTLPFLTPNMDKKCNHHQANPQCTLLCLVWSIVCSCVYAVCVYVFEVKARCHSVILQLTFWPLVDSVYQLGSSAWQGSSMTLPVLGLQTGFCVGSRFRIQASTSLAEPSPTSSIRATSVTKSLK